MIECYLCGKDIEKGQPRSRDHVPPAQVFPEAYRKTDVTKNLDTLYTHPDCNNSYEKDEEYFVNTFLPFAHDTSAGQEMWRQTARRYQAGKTTGIVNRIRGGVPRPDPRWDLRPGPDDLQAVRR